MDFKALLFSLVPRYDPDPLTVDDTVGGVGFDPAKLVYDNKRARLVRYTLEGGNIRVKEVGTPTALSGDLQFAGDECFVPAHSIDGFRAIRAGAVNATLRYQPYF